MIQTVGFQGEKHNVIAEQVNEWLADRTNYRYQVLDITFHYSDSWSAADIIYEDDPHDTDVNVIQLPKYRG